LVAFCAVALQFLRENIACSREVDIIISFENILSRIKVKELCAHAVISKIVRVVAWSEAICNKCSVFSGITWRDPHDV